jgi:hypothetical protein
VQQLRPSKQRSQLVLLQLVQERQGQEELGTGVAALRLAGLQHRADALGDELRAAAEAGGKAPAQAALAELGRRAQKLNAELLEEVGAAASCLLCAATSAAPHARSWGGLPGRAGLRRCRLRRVEPRTGGPERPPAPPCALQLGSVQAAREAEARHSSSASSASEELERRLRRALQEREEGLAALQGQFKVGLAGAWGSARGDAAAAAALGIMARQRVC